MGAQPLSLCLSTGRDANRLEQGYLGEVAGALPLVAAVEP